MFAISLILILSVQLAPVASAKLNRKCPGDYTKIVHADGYETCFWIPDTKGDYLEAKAICRNNTEGKLVTAETAWRRDNLKQFLKENTMDSGFIFIGAQEDLYKGTFVWDGFSTAPFWSRENIQLYPEMTSSWRWGEPDNTNGNEQCVCPKSDGKWNDCKCVRASREFICEVRDF